jgi:hypothetical protein
LDEVTYTPDAPTPPLITQQPTNQVVVSGQTATFTVAASGSMPLFYQWRKNGVALPSGCRISGVTSNVLAVAGVVASDADNYTVVVSNSLGSVTSSPPAVLSWLPFPTPVAPPTVYENTNDLNRNGVDTIEYGDQITLAADRTERYLTQFEFTYYAHYPNNGNETAILRLYRNDGSSGAPGTLLFTSAPIPLARGVNNALVPLDSLLVPNTFTWTFRVSGLTGSESAGLEIGNPPTIGLSDSNAFWYYSGGWATWSWPSVPANFLARVSAASQPGTPFLLSQPTNLTVRPGTNALLTTAFKGTLPVSMQWQHEGTNLVPDCRVAGVAGTNLSLLAVTPADAGIYSLTAANSIGRRVSSEAGLSVLSAPWQDRDIGPVGRAGFSSLNAGTFTLRGNGVNISDAHDSFHFTYLALVGDGQIVARVASFDSSLAHPLAAKVGVMIRETLNADSRHALMAVSSGSGTVFRRRVTTSDLTSVTVLGDGVTAPYWVKLVRSGSTFSGYKSVNGAAWELVGTDTIAMGSTAYIGLAASSVRNAGTCTVTFDNVQVSGSTPWP